MEDTMKNLVEKTFGKDAEDMVIINSLATHPSARGRGYGGALVDYVSQRVCKSFKAMVEVLRLTIVTRPMNNSARRICFQVTL